MLTPTALCEASTSVTLRLKQWEEKRRQWVRGLSAVRMPLCLSCAPAGGHWLPSTPWSILLDTRLFSSACCAVGSSKHDGAVAPNLNIKQPTPLRYWRQRCMRGRIWLDRKNSSIYMQSVSGTQLCFPGPSAKQKDEQMNIRCTTNMQCNNRKSTNSLVWIQIYVCSVHKCKQIATVQ